MSKEKFSFDQRKTDSLTGLYDREVIVDYANFLISEGTPFSFALIDIDNFKNVNDSFGHTTGDKIICQVASKIRENFSEKGIIGRFGGDEFLIVIKDVVDYDEIWTLLRTSFRKVNGFSVEDVPGCFITCTLGLSRFQTDGKTYPEIMEKADKALYRGKMKGRSCFIIYLEEKHKNIVLKSSDDVVASPMQRITTLYRIINEHENLYDGITEVLKNFSSTMMIDCLSVQSQEKIVATEIHSLSIHKELNFIKPELFVEYVSNTHGIFYQNDIKQSVVSQNTGLSEKLNEQHTKSLAYTEIRYNSKVYGYLRAESVSHVRIWQKEDLHMLVIAANAFAQALHYQNKELDDLL